MNNLNIVTNANEVERVPSRIELSRVDSNQTVCVRVYIYDIANKKTNYSSNVEIIARGSSIAINVEVNVCLISLSLPLLLFLSLLSYSLT